MAAGDKIVYEFGPFRVDPDQRVLMHEDQPVRITPKAFDTLLILVKHSCEVLTKDELMKMVWPDAFVEEGNLSQNIFVLRKALGDTREVRRYIVTLPGRGYRFVAHVRTLLEDGNDLVISRRSKSQIVLEQNEDPRAALRPDESRLLPPSLETATRPPLTTPRTAELRPGSRRRILASPLVLLGAALVLAPLVVLVGLSRRATPRPVRITQITNSGKVEPWGRIRIDGSKIYFLERHGSAWPLMQVSASGGVAVPVSTPFPNTRVFGVSPDGSELLIANFTDLASDTPLWTMTTATGALHRVGDVMVHDAAWYPDGKRILCSRGREVFSVKADGSGRQPLFKVGGLAEDFFWRPDGTAFRFDVRDNYENASLWEASPGERPREIPPQSGQPKWNCCGAWTSDARHYFFSSGSENQQDVWTLTEPRPFSWLGRGTAQKLTDGPHSFVFPAAGPEHRIFVIGLQYRLAAFRYDASADTFVPLPVGQAFDLAFSPDHQWVAYVGPNGLWRSRVDGSERLQLTNPPLLPLRPRWSADGRKILFKGYYQGQPGTPYVVDAAGGTTVQLVKDGLQHSSFADWSPDGHFAVADVFPEGGEVAGIYVIDLRDKTMSRLPGSVGLTCPRWSPDGRYIVARTADETKTFLYDTRMQQWKLILTGHLISRYEWESGGRGLFFQDMLDPHETVFRFDVPTGAVRSVHDFSRPLQNGAVRCAFEGFAPDGSLLASIRSNNGDIYALDLDLP